MPMVETGGRGRDVRNAASPNSSLGGAAASVRGVSLKCYDYFKVLIVDNFKMKSFIMFVFQLHDHCIGCSSNGYVLWYCAEPSWHTKEAQMLELVQYRTKLLL
jgi:hypothetical protein